MTLKPKLQTIVCVFCLSSSVMAIGLLVKFTIYDTMFCGNLVIRIGFYLC